MVHIVVCVQKRKRKNENEIGGKALSLHLTLLIYAFRSIISLNYIKREVEMR